MILNPDLTNHVQDVIFGRKTKKLLHPCLSFNDISLKNSISQKHLGLTLDVKRNFVEHIKNITQISTNPSKTISTDYIQNICQKSVRLCGCHLRPGIQLPESESEKLESVQYNVCLAITGAIRGTSSENLYQELGLETLKSRRWFRKLLSFPLYLFDFIPNLNRDGETRHSNNIPAIHTRHNYFKNSFYPSTLSEWNNLDCKIRNSGSPSIFKKNLLNFIRPSAESIFNIHNPYAIKLLTRFRLGLGHLRDHKFRHCFQDTLNPLWTVVMILK